MKFLLPNKALILLLLFNLNVPVTAMIRAGQYPEHPYANIFSAGKHAVLMARLRSAESNVSMGSNIEKAYAEISTDDLEEIIALVKVVLEKRNYFELAYKRYSMDGRAFDKESYRKQLTDALRNAEEELIWRKAKPKPQTPPISKQPVQERPMQIPVQALPVVPSSQSSQVQQAPFEIEFSNQNSDKFVTAWVQTSPDNKWEPMKLLPFKDSQSLIPVKGSVTHFYVGSEAFVLIPQENVMILAKEVLTDKYQGRLVTKYVGTQEIKRINLRYPAKLLIIINPDSSITLTQRN